MSTDVYEEEHGIFLTHTQYEMHQKQITVACDDIARKRNEEAPGKIHKWNPIALVNTGIAVVFKNGEPVDVLSEALKDTKKSLSLGPCKMVRTAPSDRFYVVDKWEQFATFSKIVPHFRLKLGHVSDGCCSGNVASAYTADGNSIADFAYDLA